MSETVQVLRGGQARAYVIAREDADGSLLLAMQVVANLIISIGVVIIGSLIHHISPSVGQYARDLAPHRDLAR